MKKRILNGLLLASVISVFAAPTAAVTVNYSNTPGSSIRFDPTDGCGGGAVGCFDFFPTSPNNIQVTSGTAIGSLGVIAGTFGVGTISSPTTGLETASVTGSGTLTVNDGAVTPGILSADLAWIDIASFGVAGSINTQGTANLTNITYTGSDTDLVALANAGTGIQTATFQFTSATSLTDLFSNSSQVTTTSFSGSIAAVPLPAAVWLFGSGLLGLVGIARRRRG